MNRSRVPEVSVGVPVYNGETHLRASLDALLLQSFEDFELIVSDNHSTDATEAICREAAARDPRIRYERSDRNRGAAWNFNRLVGLAQGRYFKWASANDLHAPEFLARCVEVLRASPEVVLCYPKSKIIDDHGEFQRDCADGLDLPWPEPSKRFIAYLRQVRLSNPIFGLIRPEVLRRTSLLGAYPGSDVVLLGELCLYGTFREVPEFLFYRRIEQQNMIRNQSVENWQEFFDPESKGRAFMQTWRHLYEYARVTLRSPLSVAEKARISARLGRIAISERGDLARELARAAWKRAGRTALPKA